MFKPSVMAAIAAACLTLPVQAATTLPAQVITASRLTGQPAGTPIYVLDRSEISRLPARNLADVLGTLPGVAVRRLSSSPDSSGTLDVRGFGAAAANNVLVLLDGRRLNDVDSASTDLSGIPVENIERIEFLPGGGSVLYGDGASGGTINIITRSPVVNSASLAVGSGSHGLRQVTGNAEVVSGNAGVRLFGQHLDSDGYRDNSASRMDEIGLDAQATRDRTTWYLKANASQRDNRLPGPRKVNLLTGLDELHGDPQGTAEPNNYAEEDRYQLWGGWRAQFDEHLTLILDGSRRHKVQHSFFDDYSGFGASIFTRSTSDTTGVTPRATIDYTTGAIRHGLQAGLDLYETDYLSHRGQQENTDPIHIISINARSRSLYLFQSSRIDDTTLTLGGRKTDVRQTGVDTLDPAAPGSSIFDSQAPAAREHLKAEMYELGLSQAIGDHLVIMAGASRNVRLGTVDETFEYDSNFQQVFSPLLPQVGKNLEVSAQLEHEGSLFTATLYQLKLENEIHFNPMTFTNDNLDPTERRGFTLAARMTPASQWTLDANLTVQRAEFREGVFAGNDIPLVASQLGNLTVSWKPRSEFTVALSDAFTGKRYMDNDQTNSFIRIPAAHRLDLKLVLDLKPLSVSLDVFNLADNRDHYEYAVRSTSAPRYNTYPLSPREYRLGLAYQF